MKKLPMTIASILLTAASNGFAMEQSWYGKVGFGTTDYDVSEFEGEGLKLDDPNGYTLTLGYQWSPFVAFEGSYVDMGEASDRVSEQFGNLETDLFESEVSAKVAVSATTLALGTVITTDANQPLSGGLKLGYHFWDADAKVNASSVTTFVTGFDGSGNPIVDSVEERLGDSASDDGSDLYYGLVGTYRTGQWLVSLEHTVYQSDDSDPSVTAIAFGMQF